ncbi:MFS transporter [Planobispora longispora]|uniref:MFS transporter n=1 Tax=Planobispora longispora TaxID=28887 RepID=A0A8J3W7W4_9ACTN|nr:MFS transporter [Planobispora longispora]GIH78226.1 MFS transporter [Planobispora longispora]
MPPKPADHSAQPAIRRKWLALVFIVTAQLMVVLDGTIVNIALPAAQADLGFGDHDRQWAVTAYALAFGSLLLIGGRVADLFGQKRAFLIGLVGFAGASVLGGLASSLGLLIAARAGQGVFGALLAPAALSLISITFTDAKERAKAFGVFSAVAASGGALGLLFGGVLTEYLSWNWCMFVNVAFAAIAFAGAAVLVPNEAPTARPRLDVLGAVTVTVGLVALAYGVARVETAGWTDALTVGSLLVGVVLVALFVLVQRRTSHPLLPLHILLHRDRGGSLLVLTLINFGLFGLFPFLTYYLQVTLGFSALQTGFAFLPLPLGIIIGANLLTGLLRPRVGPRLMAVSGTVIAAGGLLILQTLAVDSAYAAVVLPAPAVIGLGVGLVYPAALSTGTLGVATEDAGAASAAVNMAQQVGGSIGTAVLSSIYGSAVAGYLSDHAGTDDLANEAAVNGYHLTFAVAAIVLLGAALISALLVRNAGDPTGAADEAPAPVAVH